MGLARQLIDRRTGAGMEARGGFGSEMAKVPGPTEGLRPRAGQIVTPDTAIRHIDLFAPVSLIADAIAMLPCRAHRQEAQTAPDGSIRLVRRKLARQPLLLTDPMPGELMPEFSLKHRMMDSLLLTGNSYSEINAVDLAGFPSVLTPIHPTKVRDVRLNSAGMVEYVMHDGGILGSFRNGGTMVHVPGYIQAGSLKGLSPIDAGRQGISLGMAAETYGAGWFGEGAHPMGYLKNPNEVDKREADAAKRKWVSTYGGLSREPAYLYGGLEWVQVQVDPDTSQFIETRGLQARQIAKLYRVAPHMVGEISKATSWGTGLEEQNLGFVVFTLGPWITRVEQVLTWLLPRGQYVKANVGGLLRGRTKDRYAAYSAARQWGWMSVNEIRELEDMAPIEGGDIYLEPLNMQDAAAALLDDDGGTGDNGFTEDDDDDDEG